MRRCAVQIAGRLVRQRIRDGSLTSADATTTLLLASTTARQADVPRDPWPDAPEQLHGSVMTLASRYTGIDERQLDVFPAAVNLGRRLKFWNTNPIRLLRIWLSSSSSSRPDLTTAEQIVARRGPIRQPIMFIRVDLPEPDGPISATHSRIDPRIDPIQHWESPAPEPIRFRQALQEHHRLDASWVHSYRNASIGSSDAARRAGYSPKKTPTAADTVTAITMACNENTIFHPSRAAQSQIRTGCRPEYRSHRRHHS